MSIKQLILVVCALLFVGLTIKHMIRGRRSAYWGGVIARESDPGSFWFTIALDAVIALGFLGYAIFGVGD